MAIINLGQVTPRPSVISGLADALATKKSEVAQMEIDRQDKSRKFFTEAYKGLWKMDQQKRDLFLDSDKGKQFLKASKKYIPEVFDEGGQPIQLPATGGKGFQPKTFGEKVRLEGALTKVKELAKRGLPPDAKTAISVIDGVRNAMFEGQIPDARGKEIIDHYTQFLTPKGNQFTDELGGGQDVGGALNDIFPNPEGFRR